MYLIGEVILVFFDDVVNGFTWMCYYFYCILIQLIIYALI
jgi:hypothetical protein